MIEQAISLARSGQANSILSFFFFNSQMFLLVRFDSSFPFFLEDQISANQMRRKTSSFLLNESNQFSLKLKLKLKI
jgi:hypothetical protein